MTIRAHTESTCDHPSPRASPQASTYSTRASRALNASIERGHRTCEALRSPSDPSQSGDKTNRCAAVTSSSPPLPMPPPQLPSLSPAPRCRSSSTPVRKLKLSARCVALAGRLSASPYTHVWEVTSDKWRRGTDTTKVLIDTTWTRLQRWYMRHSVCTTHTPRYATPPTSRYATPPTTRHTHVTPSYATLTAPRLRYAMQPTLPLPLNADRATLRRTRVTPRRQRSPPATGDDVLITATAPLMPRSRQNGPRRDVLGTCSGVLEAC